MYMLRQARSVNVLKSEATEEFLIAREDIILGIGWRLYKRRCQLRHKWGIYLRSNLEWDWDIASCLERLFAPPEEVVPPTASIAIVSLNAEKTDMWNLTTQASLPTKMRVAYKSPTGETRYKMFVSCPSSEDVVSTGE